MFIPNANAIIIHPLYLTPVIVPHARYKILHPWLGNRNSRGKASCAYHLIEAEGKVNISACEPLQPWSLISSCDPPFLSLADSRSSTAPHPPS